MLTLEQWERGEASFRQIDSFLEAFAKTHEMNILGNRHKQPDRSPLWSRENLHKLIQIYLEVGDEETYGIWLCTSEDRGAERFCKGEFLLQNVTRQELQTDIARDLKRGYDLVESWRSVDLLLIGRIDVITDDKF